VVQSGYAGRIVKDCSNSRIDQFTHGNFPKGTGKKDADFCQGFIWTSELGG